MQLILQVADAQTRPLFDAHTTSLSDTHSNLYLMHIPDLYLSMFIFQTFIWCTCLSDADSRSLSDSDTHSNLYLIHIPIFNLLYIPDLLSIYISWRHYLMHMPISEQTSFFLWICFYSGFVYTEYIASWIKTTSQVCLVLMRRNVLYNLYNVVIRLLFFAYKGSCDHF